MGIIVITEFIRLCEQAQIRKGKAFRPGTVKNHLTMMKKYVTFCISHKVKYIKPTPQTICAYTEYLATQFSSHKSVNNYLSAIKLLHSYVGQKATAMDSFDVVLMNRAVRLTMRQIPFSRPPITVEMLQEMCYICERYGKAGTVIKLALQLGFFGFLRGSNLCPPTMKAFDPTRHLRRKDVRVTHKGLVISLKWSKTLQTAGQPLHIPVPHVADTSIDAVHTFKSMKEQIKAPPDAPLFTLPEGKQLTLPQLRKVFKALLRRTGNNAKTFSLHSLRRGGATTSFEYGAKELDIKRQGSWASTCYTSYIINKEPHKSSVCDALVTAATKNTNQQ